MDKPEILQTFASVLEKLSPMLRNLSAGLMLSVLFSFGCFRKKTERIGLEPWLESHYPGRFTLISTRTTDVIGNISFSVKKSVVAEKIQPLIQAEIEWDKRRPIEISTSEIDSVFVRAHVQYEDAIEIHDLLAKTGIPDVATGVFGETMHIMIFDKPTPENRDAIAKKLSVAIGSSAILDKYWLSIKFCDERDGEYQDIYPVAYWCFQTESHISRVSYQLELRSEQLSKLQSNDWQLNTASRYFNKILDSCRLAASDWVRDQISHPIEFTNMTEVEKVIDQPHTYRISFPYIQKRSTNPESDYPEPDGSLVGILNTDTGSFMNIHVVGKTTDEIDQ